MRTRIAVFGGLGALGTLLALGFLLAPGPLLSIGPVAALADEFGTRGVTSVMLLAALLVGLYGALTARSGHDGSASPERTAAARRFDAARTTPPEAVTAGQRRLTAAGYDRAIAGTLEGTDEAVGEVRELLSETAVSVYADAHELPRDEALAAIQRGEWTTDPVAAAFLAGPAGPTPSNWERIRLWLVPGAERERRIEHTVAAIETQLSEGRA